LTSRGRWLDLPMVKKRERIFRISKQELIKTISRRPKGFFKPSRVHKSKKIYNRRRAKQDLREILNTNG